MKRLISIFVTMLLILSLCTVTAWAAETPPAPLAAPEDAVPDDTPDAAPDDAPDAPDAAPDDTPDVTDGPVIEVVSEPSYETNSKKEKICFISAVLSKPLDKDLDQKIQWKLNWNTWTDKDTSFVTTSGTVSTLKFLVYGDQQYRVEVCVLQGREPIGEPKVIYFDQDEAPEGAVVIESMQGLPEVLPVGETATVTATLSRPLKGNEEVAWVIDSGIHTGEDVVTEGTVSTCPFTPADVHIGEHVIYVYVCEKDGPATGVRLKECLVVPAEEPIVPVPLEKKPDSPIDVEIKANEGGGSVVYNLPISTATDLTPVSKAADIFVVPEDARIQVVDPSDAEVAADKPFATGQKINVYNAKDQVIQMGTAVVKGDVTGSGMLNIAQLTRMAQAVNGAKPLTGVYLEAGDYTNSGSILIADLVIFSHMLHKGS